MKFTEVLVYDDGLEGGGRGKTSDVRSDGSFENMLIKTETVKRLKEAGFLRPSPVQLKAIPVGLTGLDMLVQAKSGTGKTLVFSILAIENIVPETTFPQKLIIAPTREIAGQIKETIRKLAPPNIRVALFVGGISMGDDIATIKKGIHIVVGTVGRLSYLVKSEKLNLSHVDFFAMDEADHLMNNSFLDDVNLLFSSLPPTRQVCVFSATYPFEIEQTLNAYMKDVTLIKFNADDVQLVGIKQYVVRELGDPNQLLATLLSTVQFVQALVFTQTVDECEPLAQQLIAAGFAAEHISGQIVQKQRDKIIEKLKANKIKILVSTDLTARGVDAENVDLVVNMGVPIDIETYFHRIGRAARYGGYGAAVTMLYEAKQIGRFTAMVCSCETDVRVHVSLLKELPPDLPTNQDYWERCKPYKAQRSVTFETSSESRTESKENGLNRSETESNSKTASDGQHSPSRSHSLPLRRFPRFSPLTRPADRSPPRTSYTREQILGLREGTQSTFPKILARLFELGLHHDQTVSAQLDCLANLAAGQREDTQKQPQVAGTSNAAAEPAKYKFVPTRKQAKKKFYMKGEMLAIRNLRSAEQWKKFAENKYDLKEEPFVDAQISIERNVKKSEKNAKREEAERGKKKKEEKKGPCQPSDEWTFATQALESKKKREKNTPEPLHPPGSVTAALLDDIKHMQQDAIRQNEENKWLGVAQPSLIWQEPKPLFKYSRRMLFTIRKLATPQKLLALAKSKYDMTKDPFVTDQRLRVPYAEQIRVQRVIEKEQRQKVMREREKKIASQLPIYSSGTEAKLREIKEEKLQLYSERLREEYMQWKAVTQAAPNAPKKGPVIPFRHERSDYDAHVRHFSCWLNSVDTKFEYLYKVGIGSLVEMFAQTAECSLEGTGNEDEAVEDGKLEESERNEKNEQRENELKEQISSRVSQKVPVQNLKEDVKVKRDMRKVQNTPRRKEEEEELEEVMRNVIDEGGVGAAIAQATELQRYSWVTYCNSMLTH